VHVCNLEHVGVVMLFLDRFYYQCLIPTANQALAKFTVSCCTFHTLYMYCIDAHLREHIELGLIFGFEQSSCLYFILHVRCRRKYKMSR